jgi:hypothetical protein
MLLLNALIRDLKRLLDGAKSKSSVQLNMQLMSF